MRRRDLLKYSAAALTFPWDAFSRPAKAVGIFDAHFHIIDPRFPVVANEGYVPPPFSVNDYQKVTKAYGITGGAVVAGSFQGEDRAFLRDALQRLGPTYVGVVQLPFDVADGEIRELDKLGVRAVRFTVRRGAMPEFTALERFARRLFELRHWHLEFYVDGAALETLFPLLAKLPKISIDHLGLSRSAQPLLCQLAAKGAQIKATGFGRVDFDVAAALKAIHRVNPKSLAFGTDLPSTRAPRPFQASDIELVRQALGDDEAPRVFHDNAVAFYRPRK